MSQPTLRDRITAHHRAPEPACVAALLDTAALPPDLAAKAAATATSLVKALRAKGTRGAVEGLVREFSLSSHEGVALMCLAEALLRIPDTATRDALIRDKIGGGDWRSHLGHSPSLFVNAATWGLVVTGSLTATSSEAGLSGALTRLIARGGEPVIRRGVDIAMRMMGEQFVTGQTIAEALARSRRMEAKGFRYSYDMLGEAATTAADAARYRRDYETAIHAIGQEAGRRGPYAGPGISIKLSALHPRYTRTQRDRVMTELLPDVAALALLAQSYDIGLNIDAEEADRLDLSLDLLEALCTDPRLADWQGLGFVVQAYQKRAFHVIDWVIDLARSSGHRLMIRLVKGAYWDSEIKRAQVDGLNDFPVFTRKIHTDVSYLACAARLLDNRDAVFPQFATHNAQTLAAILTRAGKNFAVGDYEFQCLHGMGEPLYEEIVGPEKLNRPCRIYAPVGTHETLLAYLVRRLLENGANSSFVNRIQDPAIPVADLVADPVTQVANSQPVGAPHPRIAAPPDLFGTERKNSAGLDLSNEAILQELEQAIADMAAHTWTATPILAESTQAGPPIPVLNPADHRDQVGTVTQADPSTIDRALAYALTAAPAWQDFLPAARAACLARAAALMEANRNTLLSLLIREAGKTLPDAIGEIREAVDFLRYYAAQIRDNFANDTHRALGPVACISPWNFPLAIFTGQIAAALAAGNPVLAKPAEETPLIAAAAIGVLHQAGIPQAALQLLPGAGETGAALVADSRIRAVMFTGSTDVARRINRALANRLNPGNTPVPLIAETGGQNALIVDSSALAEQVVADVLISAFNSAGQRCSALRVLCLQEDIADRTLAMLRGALAELAIGNPARLATDIDPVITEAARDTIAAHIAAMRDAGRVVHQAILPPETAHGVFAAPTIIEIKDIAELTAETFGPVLHVLRFRRDALPALIAAINATGYGLTFGVHSRLDDTIAQAIARANAGNIYVNRNLIGAVVGVQPFGGHGLSGTGPKAGGPLYLRRLLSACPSTTTLPPGRAPERARSWAAWLAEHGHAAEAAEAATLLATPIVGVGLELPGPVGERNFYETAPRGAVLCVASDQKSLLRQITAALVTGNRAVVPPGSAFGPQPWVEEGTTADAILFSGDAASLLSLTQSIAAREGPIVPVHVAAVGGQYPLPFLVLERSVSTNTAAAGGNAHLMTMA